MWVRRVRCHVCGGPKVTPSRTAHDHCSWCGTFTDWNHRVAYETRGSMQPGPRYHALRTYLTPQLESARRRADLPGLAGAYRQLYAQHVADCPAAYSPRAHHEPYRDAIVAFEAAKAAARLLDARATALEADLARVAQTLFYIDRPEGRFVRPDRFFAVYQAFMPLQERLDELLLTARELSSHPDEAPDGLLHKIGTSAFVQAWMPVLDRDTARAALESTGLLEQYEEVAEVAIACRACAGCGESVPVAEGARAVLCEACGCLLEVARVFPCRSCGAEVSPAPGSAEVACGHCGCVTPVVAR